MEASLREEYGLPAKGAMSYADKARVAMTDAVSVANASVINAGRVLVSKVSAIQGHEDVVLAMERVLEVIVAAEQLGENVKAFEEACRNALANCIDDTGAPEIVTKHHKATMARKPAFVAIEGEFKSEDDRFWNEPTPNKRAIKEALEAGEEVPGCELRRPNSLTLRITTRKS